jgi:hypothetical protein
MTSVDTPNSIAVGTVAVLKTLLANVMQKVMRPSTMVTIHFFHRGQFIGLPYNKNVSIKSIEYLRITHRVIRTIPLNEIGIFLFFLCPCTLKLLLLDISF